MKRTQKIIIGVIAGTVSFFLLLLIIAGGFKLMFSQKTAETFEINKPDNNTHILIATQGSKFKEKLVEKVIGNFNNKKVYIKGIDVSLLNNININDWHSILIINSIESGKLEKNVEKFIQKNITEEKIVLVTTSGSGKWKSDDYEIDSISTASKINKLESLSRVILEKINK